MRFMSVTPHPQPHRKGIAPGRERYLAHGEHLMTVVLDLTDGPAAEPDPPHSHPHEQITYVAAGNVRFFLDGDVYDLSAGDLIVVPSNIPHSIQTLSAYVRLVDTFHPIREEFLSGERS